MEQEQSIYTFFDSILSSEIGELEIDNFIENKTDNFNINKLKLLLSDIKMYLFIASEDKMAEYSELDIKNALNEFAKRKIEVPTKNTLTFSEEKKLIPSGKTTLDIEKLLYPFYFFPIQQLIKKINSHIEILSNKKDSEYDLIKLESKILQQNYEVTNYVIWGISENIKKYETVEKKINYCRFCLKNFKQDTVNKIPFTIDNNDSLLSNLIPTSTKIIDWLTIELSFLESKQNILINEFSGAQEQPHSETNQPTFENKFDTISPTEIYKHFKAGLVDKGYLTEHELNEYLKTAFELKTIPETLFKIKDAPNKSAIEAVFYKYYKNVAGKIHGKQNQYAALLGNYFEGYKTTTVSSNFSKSVY